MTLEEYTKEIILNDVERLQFLYTLKRVIRSDLSRSVEDCTESVAEHIFGMHLLAQYFLPLEDPLNKLDKSLVYELITAHDLDEIITGDIVGWKKTDADRIREDEATIELLSRSPELIKEKLKTLLKVYKEQKEPEAKFVKAIDKLDPHIQFFSESLKWLFTRNKITADKAMRIKVPYLKDFPYINKCNQVIHEEMLAQDYYYKE